MNKAFSNFIWFCLGIMAAGHMTTFAAEKFDKYGPPITVMVLNGGPGVPDGWIDSTTRPDATNLCNYLIATQSREDSSPISRSRCIIQVQE